MELKLRRDHTSVIGFQQPLRNRHLHHITPQTSTTMAAPITRLSSQEEARVEDYLTDKIQSSTDLESLDSLLSNLRVQHELQQKQVWVPSH
jgi:hypothetical protein